MRRFFTTEGTEENLMKQGLSECDLSRSGQRPFTTENTEGTEKKPEEKKTEGKKTEGKKTEETFSVCSVFSVVNTLFDCDLRQEGQPCS
jgi:hypothetical protein